MGMSGMHAMLALRALRGGGLHGCALTRSCRSSTATVLGAWLARGLHGSTLGIHADSLKAAHGHSQDSQEVRSGGACVVMHIGHNFTVIRMTW